MSERGRRPRHESIDDPAAAEADVDEQDRLLVDDPDAVDLAVRDDVDPADAHEQQLSVDYDEDDYR